MSFVEIATSKTAGSKEIADAQLAVVEYLDFVKNAKGCKSIIQGYEAEDKQIHYTITVWDSYESYTKLHTYSEYLPLLEAVKKLESLSCSSVQNIHLDTDAATLFDCCVVEFVTIKPKEGHSVADVKTAITKIQEATAHKSLAMGDVMGDAESIMLLVPWDSIESAKSKGNAVHAEIPLAVNALCAISDIRSVYAAGLKRI
ncbi:hypothetical protein HYPSUDRAFT_217040 [Hypholoma sublateritium FD-334 SS-4]|uniref:ABM domain-containing protein n=1 Tax=Hypholoma sublateritium (strain FD-334 SS-4) TaxID=945553 RepID=A0A0D2NND1_HYPSF|nr:hypothetical protein HYPSUDRAFT_217040 [Hypholoma sublateritium FD-334 SS-4]